MLLLFDIDGTLLLSRGAGMQCFLQACAELFGREFRRDGLRFGGGLDPLIWRDLCALNGVSASEAHAQHGRFRAVYGRRLQEHLDAGPLAYALPGVPQLLAALASLATPAAAMQRTAPPASAAPALTVGLLTGNYPETGALKLRAAGLQPELFAVAAWGSDAGHRRDLLPVALERCEASTGRSVPARDVVIIGDTPHDVDVAGAHGCRSLGVGTGAHPVEELLACGATHAVPDLSDTSAILRWLGLPAAHDGGAGDGAQPAAAVAR